MNSSECECNLHKIKQGFWQTCHLYTFSRLIDFECYFGFLKLKNLRAKNILQLICRISLRSPLLFVRVGFIETF